jgi:hypothetical protein
LGFAASRKSEALNYADDEFQKLYNASRENYESLTGALK